MSEGEPVALLTGSVNILRASINTLNATQWTLFKARWLGKKAVQRDTIGNTIHMRQYDGLYYFMNGRS